VALRTTSIKNFKLKIVKTRTGYQYTGYCYYRENLIWAAKTSTGPRVGHGCFKDSWSRV